MGLGLKESCSPQDGDHDCRAAEKPATNRAGKILLFHTAFPSSAGACGCTCAATKGDHALNFSEIISALALFVSILAFSLPLLRRRKKLTLCHIQLVFFQHFFILDCIVINRSSDPIAITGISIQTGNEEMQASVFPAEVAATTKQRGSEVTSRSPILSTALPVMLAPFESVHAILRFPFAKERQTPEILFSDPADRTPSVREAAPLRLTFHTSKGRQAFRCGYALRPWLEWSSEALNFPFSSDRNAS